MSQAHQEKAIAEYMKRQHPSAVRDAGYSVITSPGKSKELVIISITQPDDKGKTITAKHFLFVEKV